jgi:hypothetical protein
MGAAFFVGVGRCGLAAPVHSDFFYRQGTKVAKEEEESGLKVIGQSNEGAASLLSFLITNNH